MTLDSPVFGDGGFDTDGDGSTEGSKKVSPSGEDASETSGASSSRSSVELIGKGDLLALKFCQFLLVIVLRG